MLIYGFKWVNHEPSIYGKVSNHNRFLRQPNIQFKGSYLRNNVNQILCEIDVLIVPSTLMENYPLVSPRGVFVRHARYFPEYRRYEMIYNQGI